jgi:hypothetical protein
MSTIVIWGESDHETRAKSLATAYATTARSVGEGASKVAGLDKLVFWGHGEISKFCGLRAPEFVKLVGQWKSANDGLTTVEMLTCNARHRQRGSDSYTEQVVNELSRKKNKKADKVKFRALPVATTNSGKTCDWSILKWHGASATWAYVAATDVAGDVLTADSLMHAAVAALEDFKTPRGTNPCYRTAFAAYHRFDPRTMEIGVAKKYKWDAQKTSDYTKKLISVKDNTSVTAGTLGLLRWMLVDIK